MNRNGLGLIFLIGAGLIAISAGKRSNKRGIDPVKGKITSGFGNRIHPITKKLTFHNGVDIDVNYVPVVSPWDGDVTKTYFADKGGNQIVIKHRNGFQSGYAHLSKFLVKPGEFVKAGDQIAISGNTGASTGAHLHFTLRDPEGNLVDPTKYFDFA